MARLTKRLTEKGIKAKKPGMHPDGDGLYLQVTENLARTWILRTVVRGKRRDMGLGGYATVSLAEARTNAEKYRKIARDGGDPFAERDKGKAKPPPSFREAALTVHAEHAPTWKNPKHADQWINTLTEYAFPIFGKKRIDEVTSADVLNVLSPIWLTKPETARRVKQRIGAVLDWARASGHRIDNPIEGIKKGLPKQKDKPQHHPALPYPKVPAFIAKIRSSEAGDSTKLAFEYLILTATRTTEVLEATWEEIDLKEGLWTIPEGRMKASRPHFIPLSSRCVEILKVARKLSEGDGYVFPARREGKPLSNGVFLMMLRRMKQLITAHGFRSTFRDWAAEQTSSPREVAEKCLAHTLGGATETAYLRTDFLEKRRLLMETWATYSKGTKGNVIPLKTTKKATG